MSLLIWLPLNGDARNIGIKGAVPTALNITYENNGKIGKTAYFNGSNSGILIPGYSLPSGTSNWSFAAWVKPTDTMSGTACFLMSCRTAANNTGYSIYIYPNNRIVIHNGGVTYDLSDTNIVQLNIWHHIACSIAGATMKIYIDGNLKFTGSGGNSHTPNANGIAIGGAQNNAGNANITDQRFKGYMQDVRIYNNALSEVEVQELAKGLILHYPMSGAPYSNLNSIRTNLLPSGYQEVEYVENDKDGLAYIDLGLSFPDPYNGEIKMIGTVACSNLLGTRLLFAGFGPGNKGNYLEFYTNNRIGVFSTYSGPECVSNLPYHFEFGLNASRTYVKVNGVTNTTTGALSASLFNSGYIFSYLASTGQAKNIRFYHTIVYDNNVKVRDLYPCYRISDNKVGFYDIVSNTFFLNANTSSTPGELTCGPLVKKIPDTYLPLEYILSDGLQYIDTSYIPNTNSEVRTTLMHLSNTSSANFLYGSRTGSNTGEFYFFVWPLSDSVSYGYSNSGNSSIGTISKLKDKVFTIYHNKGFIIVNMNNTKVTKNVTNGAFTGTRSMFLFAILTNTTWDSQRGPERIYNFEILESGIPKRDFRPALRKSDSVPGMYDLVNDVFYTKGTNSTGEFTYGYITNGAKEWDISGYGHDLIANQDLSLFIKDNSKRYNYNYLTASGKYFTTPTIGSAWRTVSFWFYPVITPATMQVLWADYESHTACGFYPNGNTLLVSRDRNKLAFTINNISTTNWNHIVLIYNENKEPIKAYCNNVILTGASSSSSDYWRHNAQILEINGRENTGESSLAYLISDFRVYATELSNTEVEKLYNMKKA